MVAPSATLSLTEPFLVTSPGGFFRNNSRFPFPTLYDPLGLTATKGAEEENSVIEDDKLKLLVNGTQCEGK
jgi:hypothetical protein